MANNSFQYNIGINVNANTKQAEQQFSNLKAQLTELSSKVLGQKLDLSQSINATKATQDVIQLTSMLHNATDAAGHLDMSKFTQSLNVSHRSLNDYAASFKTLGAEGQKAFLQINAAVASAEKPLIRAKGLLQDFINQMVRTTSIQLSYGILNSFVDVFRNGISYAQRLDKSLTDIQIVTKQNTQEITKFAERANRAAKELAVSTTEYTDAALIFYQQGLDDEAVKERTDVTIKMANASGEAAKDISSYMTAIWNNFDDGSHTLEYYADVIAKLGADTAASNADIAEGMQDFAAVADTVGLSFEYASSALALLVDKTQQSANVIGNSLKTIFARLESVSLGDTLDDDTNLTKYTKALEKVGVSIKEADGGLKDMDTILDELGAKWENLNEQQKMGVAYTVAGVRQYNNFISLMDNYGDYVDLIDKARRSTGELNKEQQIYADSWEAARDQVTAAAQGIYQSILDDKFFKEITRMTATVLNGIEKIIDGIGGMKGTIILIGTLATSLFRDKIAKGINVLKDEFAGFFNTTQVGVVKDSSVGTLENPQETLGLNGLNAYDTAQVNVLKEKMSLQKDLAEYQDRLTDQQKLELQLQQKVVDLLGEKYLLAKQEETTAKASAESLQRSLNNKLDVLTTGGDNQKSLFENSANLAGLGKSLISQNAFGTKEDFTESINQEQIKSYVNGLKELLKQYEELGIEMADDTYKNIQKILGAWDTFQENGIIKLKNFQKNVNILNEKLVDSNNVTNIIKGSNKGFRASIEDTEKAVTELTADLQQLSTAKENEKLSSAAAAQAEQEHANAINNTKQMAQEYSAQYAMSMGDALSNVAAAAGKISLTINGVHQITKAFTDDSLGSVEKLVTAITGLGTVFMAMKALMKQLTAEETLLSSVTLFNTMAVHANTAAWGLQRIALKLVQSEAGTTILGLLGIKVASEAAAGAIAKTLVVAGVFTVAIVALVLAIKGLKAAYDAIKAAQPEEQLKRAKEHTTECADAANEAADAYSNLKDTINGLDSVYDNINKLTIGTREWRDAIADANKQAAELIDKYNLKDGDYVMDSNGLITLTESGKNKALDNALEEKNKADRAYAASLRQEDRIRESINTSKVNSKLYSAFGANTATSEEEWYKAYQDAGKFMKENGEVIANAIKNGLSFENDNWQELAANTYDLTQEQIALLDGNKTLQEAMILNSQSVDENTAAILSIYADDIAQLINNNSNLSNLSEDDKKVLVEAMNSQRQEFIDNAKTNLNKDNLTDDQWKDYLLAHGYTYNEDTLKYSDANGEIGNLSKVKKSFKNYDNILSYTAEQEGWQQFEEWAQALNENAAKALIEEQKQNNHRMLDEDRAKNLANSTEFNYGDKDLDAEEVEIYTKQLQDANEELAKNYELARKIAVANMNYNDGLADIMKNYEDYISVLKIADTTSEDFALTAHQIKDDLSKMFEIDSDYISDKFLTTAENIELIEKAAKGDMQAIEDLQDALAQQVILDITADTTGIESEVENLIKTVNDLDDLEIEVGTSIGSIEGYDEFLNILDSLMENGAMTAQEVNDYLNSIGFEPEITYELVHLDAEQVLHKGAYIVDPDSGAWQMVEADTLVDANTDVMMPRINRKSTKSRGSAPNKTSKANKDTGTKNAKGSGGSKAKTKNLDDERERYHVINKQLTAINKELDNISKAKDRAFGQKHLDLLDAEINKYEELAKTQEQYIKEIQDYWNSDAAIMKGYGAQIDPNTGTILNYDQLVANAVAAYNAAGGSEAAEEAYNNFKKNLSNYEDSVAKMQEANATLTDYLNAIYDAKLEKVKYKVELKLDIADDDIKYLDFLMNLLKDDTYDVADKMNYIARQGEDALSKIDAVNEGLVGLFNNHMPGQGEAILAQLMDGSADIAELAKQLDLTADEVDFVRECVEHLETETINFKETFDKLNEELINSMQKFGDKIDEQVNKMEHLNNVLESFKNITNLIGKSRLGPEAYNDTLRNITEGSVNLSIKELTVRQKEYEAAKKAYEDAVAAGIDPDTLSKLEDELNAIEETFMQSWEDALQKALDALTEGLQRATDKFGDAVSGLAGSLDELSFWYDKAQEQGDNYLDKYERVYNLNKLIRDITNSIDDTDDLAGKKQLKSLMEEIEELNEKDANVSAYQLDTLRKRYELYQAEIALREAENAKSQVRMVADAEGNYNYMYTADENNISEAQGNYEDKLYAYAQANTQQLDELQQRLLENRRKLSEELAALGDGDQEKAQELIDWYTEQEEYLEEQMQLALDCNLEVNSYAIASDWDVADNFADTVYSQITGYETLEDVQLNWQEATTQMAEDVANEFEIFEQRYNDVMIAAGTSTIEFAGVVDSALSYVEQKSDEAAQESERMASEFVNAYGQALNAAVQFSRDYANVAQDVINNNVQMIKSINDLIRQLAAIGGPGYNGISNYVTSAITPVAQNGIDKLNGEIDEQRRKNNTSTTGNTNDDTLYYVHSSDVGAALLTSQAFKSKADAEAWIAAHPNDYYIKQKRYYIGTSSAVGLASGGYTGEWGTEGRLAVLHQKELVLNKEDTANMLQTVDSVRRIIELNTQAYGANADLSGRYGIGGIGAGLDQNVTIHAEFPNAVDHTEIEMAFNDLLNKASQYANRH